MMRKTMIDPESLPHDAGAKAPELVGVGEIGVAALGELRSVQSERKPVGQRRGVFRRETSAHRARSAGAFRAIARSAAR